MPDNENKKIHEQYFASLYKTLERKEALLRIDAIQSKLKLPLYLFAFLRNYASFSNVELPRRELPKIHSEQLGEYAFAVLGYFFGYKRLRNSDERQNIDGEVLNVFKAILQKPPIKFQLTTHFDYYIIELAFNFIFHNNTEVKIKEFPLDNISSEQLLNAKINNKNYEYREALLYGKLYQSLRKVNPLDEIIPLIKRLPDHIPLLSDLGLYCFRLGLKMSPFSLSDLFTNPGSIKKLVGFSKEDLLKALITQKIDAEELMLRISLSQKHKEL